VKARSSSAVAMLPLAQKTGKCEIRAQSYVKEITIDANGRVNGVVYFDAQKREQRQRAKAVVVSANASETPRLLLMSQSARFPTGSRTRTVWSGNSSCLATGRAPAVSSSTPERIQGRGSGGAIVDFVPSDPKRGFYGGGRMTSRGFQEPIGFGLGGLQPGSPDGAQPTRRRSGKKPITR
jgi:choline dehydrogenase-like flavoprotein